ncbi:MAG: low-specificity L-threonine aldolase [Chloroflexota bacterium]
MNKIDFRSDTVGWPTPKMREVMAKAPVGDDVYGEDPSVNELERLAAAKLGKEAAVFVASGTQGNLLGMLSHATRGDEVILGNDTHIARAEAGGLSVLGGVVMRMLPTDENGRMDLDTVRSYIPVDDPHYATTRAIAVENTVGMKYGLPLPLEYLSQIRSLADEHNLTVHMDGARLFNAAVAQNIDVADITQHVDSVTFCLSKALTAPVGSVLCGSEETIYKARRLRKLVGGSMRQVGIVASAGIVALHEMVERLSDDHENAQHLAQGLADIPGIVIDVDKIKTNIVFFELDEEIPLTRQDVVQQLRERANVLVGGYDQRFRAVTHYWTGKREVDILLETMRNILQAV